MSIPDIMRATIEEQRILYTASAQGAHATRLPCAASNLACESNFQDKIGGCDCFNYQLFMCRYWARLYNVIYRLKTLISNHLYG